MKISIVGPDPRFNKKKYSKKIWKQKEEEVGLQRKNY
jgi:hypothetical protein